VSKRPFVLVNLLLIFFLAIGIGVTISHYLATGAKIPWGVTVVDIPVGGLSVDEARSKLMACEQDILQKIVTIEFGLQKKRMTVQELGIQIDWPATLLQLSNYGHQGSFARCLRQRWFAWRDGVTLPLQLVMDTTQTEKKLTDTFTGLISESRDAKFEFRGDDEVVVIPEVNGRKIDFKNSFRDLSLLVSEQYPRVHLTLQVLTPEVTASQLAKMKITGVLASYTTSFDPEKNDRVANVKIASAALDNFTLAPGGTFSFNQVVGPRTAVAGYKEALVIQDSAFVPGLGGGVCQVSSTLYNAVLRANLPVLERHQHSLPVGYVPFGTDATVAYGLIDFKFKNNTEGHLMIRTSLSGKNLTIKLFGNAVNRPCIRIISTTEKVIEPNIIKKEDANIPLGKILIEQKGNRGYQVKVTRQVEEKGRIYNETISQDIYPAIPEIVRVGVARTIPIPDKASPGQTSKEPSDKKPDSPKGEGRSPDDATDVTIEEPDTSVEATPTPDLVPDKEEGEEKEEEEEETIN
jgi:vancomycin resistance protein YoaR